MKDFVNKAKRKSRRADESRVSGLKICKTAEAENDNLADGNSKMIKKGNLIMEASGGGGEGVKYFLTIIGFSCLENSIT